MVGTPVGEVGSESRAVVVRRDNPAGSACAEETQYDAAPGEPSSASASAKARWEEELLRRAEESVLAAYAMLGARGWTWNEASAVAVRRGVEWCGAGTPEVTPVRKKKRPD